MKIPIIGEINTVARKINYYDKVVDYVEFDEKQAQKPIFNDKNANLEQRSGKDNHQSLFSKIC